MAQKATQLFDPRGGQPANGVPHLLEHLWALYTRKIEDDILARREAGLPAVTLDEALRRAPAHSFYKWATDWLDENRVSSQFFLNDNLGLRLTNGDSVAVSPGGGGSFDMPPDTSIRIT